MKYAASSRFPMTMMLRTAICGKSGHGDAAEDVVEATALAGEFADADLPLAQERTDLQGDAAAVRRPHQQLDHTVDLRHQVNASHCGQGPKHLDRALRLIDAES